MQADMALLPTGCRQAGRRAGRQALPMQHGDTRPAGAQQAGLASGLGYEGRLKVARADAAAPPASQVLKRPGHGLSAPALRNGTLHARPPQIPAQPRQPGVRRNESRPRASVKPILAAAGRLQREGWREAGRQAGCSSRLLPACLMPAAGRTWVQLIVAAHEAPARGGCPLPLTGRRGGARAPRPAACQPGGGRR